jgi:hypothetical protein
MCVCVYVSDVMSSERTRTTGIGASCRSDCPRATVLTRRRIESLSAMLLACCATPHLANEANERRCKRPAALGKMDPIHILRQR